MWKPAKPHTTPHHTPDGCILPVSHYRGSRLRIPAADPLRIPFVYALILRGSIPFSVTPGIHNEFLLLFLPHQEAIIRLPPLPDRHYCCRSANCPGRKWLLLLAVCWAFAEWARGPSIFSYSILPTIVIVPHFSTLVGIGGILPKNVFPNCIQETVLPE